jgi:two-component system, OmpR family, sensor histidine kinase VicK
VKEIVEHQGYVFDTLWTRAIPAQERFEQIKERGVEHEFVQLITNTNNARDIFSELVKSAKEEVLLFLANDKALVRIDKLGLVDHIIKISQQANTTIKIISPLSKENSEIVSRMRQRAPSIRILNSDNYSPFGICIVDGQKLLRAEIKVTLIDPVLFCCLLKFKIFFAIGFNYSAHYEYVMIDIF